jgi:hypothetical protein
MYVSCAQSLYIVCSAPEPDDSDLIAHHLGAVRALSAHQLYAKQVDPLRPPLLGLLNAGVAFFYVISALRLLCWPSQGWLSDRASA